MKRPRARASAWFAFFVVIPILTILVPGWILISWPGGSGSVHAQENAFAGGDVIPIRQVSDPYPVFNGIAIDPANNLVAMTDVNRKSLLSYTRTDASKRGEITAPRRQVFGPRTNVGFVAGIALDPESREMLALNNDIEDTMIVLPYESHGNDPPKRLLSVPHQAWGLQSPREALTSAGR